jgi:hypothetical protein
MIGGKLGQELVVGNAARRNEAGFIQDCGPDLLGRRPGSVDPALVGGHIQICFIERERLDQIRVAGEHLVDLARDVSVDLEPWRYEHQIWATPHGVTDGRADRTPNCRAS